MGRDIHIRLAKINKETNKWEEICLYRKQDNIIKKIHLYGGARDYTLFDVLSQDVSADTLNEDILSPELQKEIEERKEFGYYGFSEINFADLRLCLADNIFKDDYEKIEGIERFNSLAKFVSEVQTYLRFCEFWVKKDSNYKIIFYFDC